jgi:hypothetical protein
MMTPSSPAGNGGSGYGAGSGSNAFGTGAYGASWSSPAATLSMPSWLDSLGLPNEGGKVAWPLGLRVLGPASEVQPLRQQIDSLLPLLAAAGRDAETTAISGQLEDALRQARRLLAENGDGLADATQAEARRFLNDISRALKKLQS